jgi:hypothetical protein
MKLVFPFFHHVIKIRTQYFNRSSFYGHADLMHYSVVFPGDEYFDHRFGTPKQLWLRFCAEQLSKKESCSFSFEESPNQLIRNMGSVGIHLGPYLSQSFYSFISLLYRARNALLVLHKLINQLKPRTVTLIPSAVW